MRRLFNWSLADLPYTPQRDSSTGHLWVPSRQYESWFVWHEDSGQCVLLLLLSWILWLTYNIIHCSRDVLIIISLSHIFTQANSHGQVSDEDTRHWRSSWERTACAIIEAASGHCFLWTGPAAVWGTDVGTRWGCVLLLSVTRIIMIYRDSVIVAWRCEFCSTYHSLCMLTPICPLLDRSINLSIKGKEQIEQEVHVLKRLVSKFTEACSILPESRACFICHECA